MRNRHAGEADGRLQQQRQMERLGGAGAASGDSMAMEKEMHAIRWIDREIREAAMRMESLLFAGDAALMVSQNRGYSDAEMKIRCRWAGWETAYRGRTSKRD